MSIYATGDIHGDPRKFNKEFFYEQNDMTNQDENYIIILGDFGLVWCPEESKQEKYWLDWLEEKNFTTLFVDGNHENHIRLNTYPIKEWHGGKVHEIRPHILHLMRGEIFNIEEKSFFAFGGASSHDISDGILDSLDPDWKAKAQLLNNQKKYMYRIKGLSWWEQELPTRMELNNGLDNLKKHNNKIDFIISHCCSTTTQVFTGGLQLNNILTDYFMNLQITIDYKKWLFGHYHIDRQISEKEFCLYEQIVRIN